MYNIALQLTVCPNQTPLSLAGVTALINGYTATNLPLPLAPIPSSTFYGAKLDTNVLFPDLVRTLMLHWGCHHPYVHCVKCRTCRSWCCHQITHRVQEEAVQLIAAF